MEKQGGLLGFVLTDERTFQGLSNGILYWKAGTEGTQFLRLGGQQGHTIATYRNKSYTGKVLGKFDTYNPDALSEEQLGLFVDEIVVSVSAMLADQISNMDGIIAAMSSSHQLG